LLGLQHIYVIPELRERIFALLEQVLPTRSGHGLTEEQRNQPVDANRGRPGMEQWKILVLGVLRLGLNTDYDRVHELANQHSTIRQMLGHSDWCDDTRYSLQSIKDNLMLFTPELFDQINQEVVKAWHRLVKKNPNVGPTVPFEAADAENRPHADPLRGRCDSFVVETHVHFPTDINLLYDAIRKVIEATYAIAEHHTLPGWRQHQHSLRQIKKQYRKIQKLKHASAKDPSKQAKREQEIKQAHQTYLDRAAEWLGKSEHTVQQARLGGAIPLEFAALENYQSYVRILLDQIDRRIIQGETIPHEEKLFSIFQPHTEWICKGKAGVPVELGLRVCIMEDQHRFILHHQVMEKQTDDAIAVEMVTQTRKRFPELAVASFDKGFHSKANQAELKNHLEQVILPKKGRLSQADQAHEGSDEFKKLRNQHSGVESAINALEQNGLDTCPDHGIKGFKCYVALAVVSRNIKRLGAVIRQQALEKEQRKREPYKKAA
jgi:transposase, IS5 family